MTTVGLVIYPGFQVLGLAVSAVFETANDMHGPSYTLTVISEHGGIVPSSLGFGMETTCFKDAQYDTLIVIGNNNTDNVSQGLLDFLRSSVATSKRITAVCTGAFVVAQAGLLEGRRATTHWAHARAFRAAYPDVRLEEDRIFVIDGAMWTSAGMTAGIDLALAIVEKDLGIELARNVAKKMVVHHRRSGGQSQFSTLLELDPKTDRIQSTLIYAKENLGAELSVEDLAEIAHLSPRQFSRIFREETGSSPAKAIEHLRVEAARIMMEEGRFSLDIIARDCGFGDRDRMRRSFLRAFGQSPQAIKRVTEAQMIDFSD
ncbi:GlxA family transcriptional regulator [Pseudomonas gingeri]|uniref:GlxA family transcriptional regulator n=1 Tax=Pseudomonas gingeri TaxID=117681 RepID=UPI0015A2F98F|nr:GlxA family transcriptional regulator [Pseudomonas gingeri]NWD72796.1 GlxA family transcriptional regulator [Pseudomonas gingeri]